MNEKRLHEAEVNFKLYIQDGLLKKISFDKNIFLRIN
jgi:hypothetical protein